ncbi:hypothetical protein M9H77_06523 [Catharanthus roseus]|uniref:Uncharacterized protein n=1 Tax=Catharanthus roseus TaxID=4058 RepID=A0ACC0BSJ7_CATRO|nr:hypothetical protein M9H77_06523 [Catharanthus roseus]
MEEVPAHTHPGPIVPDFLTRQHEHRSGLWSGDHETCFTDLQYRRFGRNLFQCYNTALRRGCTTDRGSLSHSTDLGVVAYTCIAALANDGCLGQPSCPSWCYMFVWLPYHDHGLVLSNLWRAEVPLICYEIVDYHYPGQLRENDHTYWGIQHASHVEAWHEWRLRYIRWYRGITRVYIRNPANCDTRSVGYQPTGVDRRMMHVLDRGARRVKRGTRRQPGSGARCGHLPVPPFPGRHGHADPEHVEMKRGGHPPINLFDSPNLDIPSFSLGLTQSSKSLPGGSRTLRSPAGTSLGFSSFRAPPPLGTTGSSTLHQPISQASSSNEEEWTDDTDDVQHLGFGHRVRKKTTRFTLSDWP